MSECIELLPHEECGSSDALQVFLGDDDRYTGYCFSCDTYVPEPYFGQGTPVKHVAQYKPVRDIEAELAEIDELTAQDLPDRMLYADTLEYYGVKVGVSEQDGETPLFHYYPYYGKKSVGTKFVGWKVRFTPNKQFWAVGDIKGAELFGWRQAVQTGAKTLYITEGELDAMSLYQALKAKNKLTKWADYDPAVVSLRAGAAAAKKELTAMVSQISTNFKDVVLVFDQDEPGMNAVEATMTVLPTARTVSIPEKDPNECLVKGYGGALANAVLFKAEKPKNTRLIWGRDVVEEARTKPEMGLSWPWEGMTKLTRGMRWGETIYLGAGVKMGKTTCVDTLAAHFITEHGLKVFMAQPEEAVPKTFRRIVGKVARRVFHDPDIEWDEGAYDEHAPLVGENLCMLNLYQTLDWNTLRGDIICAVEEGCRVVFIDPITNITNGIDSSEANTILQEFAQELAAIAKDLDIIVLLFCHLKAPEGKPHERGGTVYSSQFAGSRAMMRSCNLMLGLEGNKDPDLPLEERNMRRLVILEDREFGASGYVPMYYEASNGTLSEI